MKRQIKILVANHDASNLNVISYILEKQNYAIKTVQNSAELESCISYYQPDLILLNSVFAGADETTLCKTIKDAVPTSFIVLLLADMDLLQNFKECYVDDVLEMPFDLTKLKDTIASFFY